MRRLSFHIHPEPSPPLSPQHFFNQLSTVSHICIILCLSPPPFLSLSSHFFLLITDRDKSSGPLAFGSSGERKKKEEAEEEEEEEEAAEEEEEEKRRKALLSVPLLLLHGAGRTKAFPDRPDCPYLCPADASSPCVLATLPRTLFCFCHNPPILLE